MLKVTSKQEYVPRRTSRLMIVINDAPGVAQWGQAPASKFRDAPNYYVAVPAQVMREVLNTPATVDLTADSTAAIEQLKAEKAKADARIKRLATEAIDKDAQIEDLAKERDNLQALVAELHEQQANYELRVRILGDTNSRLEDALVRASQVQRPLITPVPPTATPSDEASAEQVHEAHRKLKQVRELLLDAIQASR